MSAPDCGVFGGGEDQPLCNLYSVTKGQQAIRELAGAISDRTGNLPSMAGIFPDYSAPIVRNQPEGRDLTVARWGMPSPVFALKGKKSDPGFTNVRNVKSPHWQRWLGIENHCVVDEFFRERGVAGRHPSTGLVRIRRDPAVSFLRWHLDALDLRPESERRRNDQRRGRRSTSG
jgi:putative SOS response-associated peptidase YedK